MILEGEMLLLMLENYNEDIVQYFVFLKSFYGILQI
jgi:hypothetical protein